VKRERILVAEDDRNIRVGLVDALVSEGYDVEAVENGAKALKAFRPGQFQLVLLDIMMPEVNGYDVCRGIRKQDASVPLIMLTAKGEEVDKVVGLELGADDYVVKPFGVRELLARIAAVLRRSRTRSAPQDDPLPDVLAFGPAEVNRKTYTATLRGKSADLTARELRLIEVFYLRPGEVLTRDDLLNDVWGTNYMGTTRTLDQHIAQLRKKIEPRPEAPQVIVTVHGVGYRYAKPA
jgi:DNA-binding response OmpR family regulator